jgi:hypothetical protein
MRPLGKSGSRKSRLVSFAVTSLDAVADTVALNYKAAGTNFPAAELVPYYALNFGDRTRIFESAIGAYSYPLSLASAVQRLRPIKALLSLLRSARTATPTNTFSTGRMVPFSPVGKARVQILQSCLSG